MMHLHWMELPPLPPEVGKERQSGVAGAIAGAHGEYLMVAGGANFEHGKPWEGGPKVLHDAIFLLGAGDAVWRQLPQRLPRPMGYSACVSTPQGVVACGGEIDEGPINEVALFAFEEGMLRRTLLPPLPQPLSAAGATVVSQRIYLAGGMNRDGAVNALYCLDLNRIEAGWETAPDLPRALSHAVVVSQYDGAERCVYLLGGRYRHGDLSTFSSAVWKYSPSKRHWQEESRIVCDGAPFALSAGTGIAVGTHGILLCGGDHGDLFNRTEAFNNAIAKATSDAERLELLRSKAEHLAHHPGFSRKILLYHTGSKAWRNLGETPEASQVTTPIFKWQEMILIPSGEIRPGTRTPRIVGIKIQE